MAAAELPAPGSPFGPCAVAINGQFQLVPCEHSDCQLTISMSEKVCRLCEQPIGYDTRFYTDPGHNRLPDQLVHATCLEVHEDQGAAYGQRATAPIELTPEDEDTVHDLLNQKDQP